MTTISDAFPAPAGAVEPSTAQEVGAGARPRVRARVAATERDGKAGRLASVARSAAGTVAADVRTAWPWAGHPPTLAELWAARVPDVDAVPGGSAVLRVAWAVWNHLLLLPVAAAYVALWVFAHPARALLAAAVAAPLLIWI